MDPLHGAKPVPLRRLLGLYTVALVAACALVAFACTKAAKPKEPVDADLSPKDAKELADYRAEIEIGRNMAGRLLAYYGVIDDEQVAGYVNQLGAYVASYSDYPERRYMFSVLKHESVNAFACPGGYILITMGALRAARTEAELAAVLGHEIAHVGKRHMFDALRRMKEKELEEQAKKRLAKPDPILDGRQRPKVEETGAGAMLAMYLSGSAGASLNILVAAQAGMSMITSTGLDPSLEFEADREGVRYATRAGYDPQGLSTYLTRLASSKAFVTKRVKNLEKTHPKISERKAALAKVLAELNAKEITGAKGEDRFEKVRAKFPKPND